jgi:hypothetical protein
MSSDEFNQDNSTNPLIYIIGGVGGSLFLAGLAIILWPMLFGSSTPGTISSPSPSPGTGFDQTPSEPISDPNTNDQPDVGRDECRYDDFIVNVKSVTSDFDDSLNLETGQSFRVYLFENVSNQEEIQDVDIIVEGAGVDEIAESGERIVTEEAGEIDVRASFPNCDTSEASVLVVESQQFSGTAGDGAKCGESCNSNADCVSQGTNGAPVECHQGRCVNSLCKENTVLGSRCDCSKLNPCGSPCSAVVGLCGGASCTANADPTSPNRTFCIPNNLPSGYSLETCTGPTNNSDSYLSVPEGTTITQALIQQLCGGNNDGGSSDLPATNIEIAGISVYVFGGIGFILFGLMVLIKYRNHNFE